MESLLYMILITSVNNPKIKEASKLRDKPYRDETGRFLVEGYREIKRAFDNKKIPEVLFFSPELFLGENEPALIEHCGKAGSELIQCSEKVFRKLAYRDRPEGLLAVMRQFEMKLSDIKLKEMPLVVVAETIEKPGNLGTILRSADAVQADAVLVCDRCTDIYNPNVVRASIGALFTVPVIECKSDEALKWLKEHHVRILAATPHTDNEYTDVNLSVPLAIVVGREQVGLSNFWMEQAELKVKIPMLGQIDSLNVATATAIILFEAIRQRRALNKQN